MIDGWTMAQVILYGGLSIIFVLQTYEYAKVKRIIRECAKRRENNEQ